MIKLTNILVFIIKRLKDKQLASPSFLKRIVYLIDWEYCKVYGKQLTNVNWIKDEDGISIEYFNRMINDSLDTFKINPIINSLCYLSLLNPKEKYTFEDKEFKIVNKIWKQIGNKSYEVLASKVFSTFPNKYYSSKSHKTIDLVKAAKKSQKLL